MRIFLLMSLLVLTGCLANQYKICKTHQSWLAQAECADKVAATDWDVANNPHEQELAAYRKLLIEKVKKGQLTEAEANYAYQIKKIELLQRIEQIRAISAQERQRQDDIRREETQQMINTLSSYRLEPNCKTLHLT